MSLSFSRETLGDGIDFIGIADERFKTNFIAVQLITELSADYAAENAAAFTFLSRSSKKYPTITELNKKLTSLYGANLSGDVTKLGDSQGMSLTASCIADRYTLDGEKVTAETAELLIECLLEPNVSGTGFEPKSFELCKQELIDDIDAEINEKRAYAVIRAGKKVFEGEPAAVTSHGDKEHAMAITAETSYNSYRSLLDSAQIKVFFVGSGDDGTVKDMFKKAFANIKRSYSGKPSSEKSRLKDKVCECTETLDVLQSKMVIAYKTQNDNVPAMRLMNAIFGATPFSKLFVNVREKMSLCYYCSSGYDDRKGVLVVDSGVEHDNIEKASEAIRNQLDDVAKGNFADEEMNNSRFSLINGIKSVNDSPYALAGWYLKQEYMGTSYSPEDEIKRLNSVSRDDIIEAAKSLSLDTIFVLTGKGEQ